MPSVHPPQPALTYSDITAAARTKPSLELVDAITGNLEYRNRTRPAPTRDHTHPHAHDHVSGGSNRAPSVADARSTSAMVA